MRSQVFALGLAASTAALADTAPPPMKVALVRGSVERVDATTMTIKTDTGAEVTAAITPKTNFGVVEARTLGQIKPTDFVGVTAVPGSNGHLRAEEIHIIPIVGLGEGQYPWDHHPSSSHSSDIGSMTNGSVASMSQASASSMTSAPATVTNEAGAGSMTNGTVGASASASELSITYHGAGMVDGKCEGRAVPGKSGCMGTAIVDVTPSTVIAAIVKGSNADAKAGLALVAFVATDEQGHSFLASATLEKNGVKPEF